VPGLKILIAVFNQTNYPVTVTVATPVSSRDYRFVLNPKTSKRVLVFPDQVGAAEVTARYLRSESFNTVYPDSSTYSGLSPLDPAHDVNYASCSIIRVAAGIIKVRPN